MPDSEVELGAAPGFFSNKRNVLLVAGLVGAGAGLIFFLMRKNTPAVPSESQASGYTQSDLQLGNIATQLLKFRGESSIAADEASQLATERNATITQTLAGIDQRTNQTNTNLYTKFDEDRQSFTYLRDLMYRDYYERLASLPAQPMPQTSNIGAGGFGAGQMITLAAFDAGDGMAGQFYPLVSGLTPRRI